MSGSTFTHLSLFSGIGGIDLAAEMAGFRTVAFCEASAFCRKVLAKHWPGLPIFPDVRSLDGAALRSLGVPTPDLISGGYPCQPFSTAGKRLGKEDPRHLWPHFRRLVHELRPRWVLGENVAGHLSKGLDAVVLDLEHLGYECRPVVVPAAAFGAPHLRHRVFVVAHAASVHGSRLGDDFGGREVASGPESSGAADYSTESGRHAGTTLTDAACRGRWASPAARDFRAPNSPRSGSRKRFAATKRGKQLPNQLGVSLHPEWVELLMGFPPGWTELPSPGPRDPKAPSTPGKARVRHRRG